MKNTLKIMGLALIAGSMMLAGCKKDKEPLTVTFSGEEQNLGWHNCASNEVDFLLEAANALTDSDAVVLPYLYHQFDNNGGAKGDKYNWVNDDLEFAELGYVMYEDYEWSDWVEEETTDFTVDEFDANTLTLSYTNTSVMASMKDLADGNEPENCRHRDLIIEVNDMKFVLDNSKASFHKRPIAK